MLGWCLAGGPARRCPLPFAASLFARSAIALGATAAVLFFARDALAQSPAASDPQAVVATVDGEAISAGEVTRRLAKVTRGQELSPAILPWLRAQVLSQIIDRRLVLAYARRTGEGPSPAQIEAALQEVKAKLKAQRRSLEEYLKAQAVSESDLRRQLAWNLVWEKDLAKYVTAPRAEAYFQAHRRELDGTEISVSHILLRPQPGDGPQAMENLVRQARQIRQEIASGKITFAEAARRYSAGPSRSDDGRLGFIPRHGTQDDAFSRAAFGLGAGQVSEPVRTSFGVHLIRCEEIRPGSRQLAEVRHEVDEVLARELLDKLARIQQGHSSVKFTGAAPHFKPGTQELVAP